MANSRLFSKDIICTDHFLSMSYKAQALYIQLSINADDDGFISNPKSIMRVTGVNDEIMTELIENQYVIPFQSGVIVIRHWKINNHIRADRYHETRHKDEKNQLIENAKIYDLLQ